MKTSFEEYYTFCAITNDQPRLDSYVTSVLKIYSRAKISDLISSGKVSLNNNKKVKAREKVKHKDIITILVTAESNKLNWQAQNIPLNIVFEDDHILVINKPAGLTVHPGAGQTDSTLANALANYDDSLINIPRMGIVHRLDKDTSGLMVVAKTLAAHQDIITQLQQRSVTRTYHAIIVGSLIAGGTINAPIGRHKTLRTAMAVVPHGKEAITHYRIIKKYRFHNLLKVNLETGRTHQIRVHLAHIKHPIVGDKTYRGNVIANLASETLKNSLKQLFRQALHAKELALVHPFSKKKISFSSEYPTDFATLVKSLEKDSE